MLIVLVNSCEQQQQTKKTMNTREGKENSPYGRKKSVVIY